MDNNGGAFCVYGVSMADCVRVAREKTSIWNKGERKPESRWLEEVDQEAHRLFQHKRITAVSPKFSAPNLRKSLWGWRERMAGLET